MDFWAGDLQADPLPARRVRRGIGLHVGGRGRGTLLLDLLPLEATLEPVLLSQDHRLDLDSSWCHHSALDSRLPVASGRPVQGPDPISFSLAILPED